MKLEPPFTRLNKLRLSHWSLITRRTSNLAPGKQPVLLLISTTLKFTEIILKNSVGTKYLHYKDQRLMLAR
jgi:hypothetical protein